MMSRMLRHVVLALSFCAPMMPRVRPAVAQDEPAIEGQADKADRAEGMGRARLARPEANAMRVPEISPEMLRVLKNWEIATGRIEKLQGKHERRIYNKVFLVENIAIGKFYFEAPNKGRLDIESPNLDTNVSQRVDPETKKPYKLQADKPESWICDGEFIYQVNVDEKSVEGIRLPAELKGTAIVDAPLPFLFGMPVEKARQRYEIAFVPPGVKPPDRPKYELWLDVKPRLPRDAADWSRATVVLHRETYLPLFVRMIDPGGNTETVYKFSDCVINKVQILPWTDPFKPPRGYRLKPQMPLAANVPAPNALPSTIGLSAVNAKDMLVAKGYEVDWIRGVPAAKPELAYVVYEQTPGPQQQLNKGQTVVLTVYDKPQEVRGKFPVSQGQERTSQ